MKKRETFIFLGGALFGAGVLTLAIGLQLGGTYRIELYGLLYVLAGILFTINGLKRD